MHKKIYKPSYKGIKSLIRKVQTEEPHILETNLSKRPSKKICDITGLPAEYTCPKTGLNYFNMDVYEYIRSLPAENVQTYLDLKNIGKKLNR